MDQLSEFNEQKNDSTTIKDNHKGEGSVFGDEENTVEAFIATDVTADNEQKTAIETQINSTDEKTSTSAPESK